MKFARYIPAGIGAGLGALALTGSAVIGGAALGGTPAAAATLAPHTAATSHTTATSHAATAASGRQTPAEALQAWTNSAGYRYLNATDAAELAAKTPADGAALTRAATLAAEHPQPVDTAHYVATMHMYAAAGRALTRGDTTTFVKELARADDMAWHVVEDTFGALDRIPVGR